MKSLKTKSQDFKEKVKRFIDLCREKGLRVTHQRLAIYEAVAGSPDHPTAEVVYNQIRKKYPMISLATVYKTLETLHEIGAIWRVNLLHDKAYYDANLDPHHHLVCIRCKKILDVSDDDLDFYEDNLIDIPPRVADFQVLNYALWIRGLCPECQGRN